jgi:DNA transposition AAA+ family ATPase
MTTTPFAEDHLPHGQPVIETKNVKRCRSFLRLITDPERRSPTMGVITGRAGVGKTIASQHYLDSLAPQAHTALPTAIKIKVMPRSTPRALAKTILDSLLEKSRGRNIYEMADEVATAIERNAIHLLIVDEADRLNEDSFDVLRHLFDKTGCRVVLVGLPTILSVIERHEKFSSRVGLRMSFTPLQVEEVLDLVLPQLVFPHWTYDPDKPSDRAMGATIWHKVNPSLRNLHSLLSTASQMARDETAPSITPDIMHEASLWMVTQPEHAKAKTSSAEPTEQGTYERISQARQDAKAKGSTP